MSNAKIRITAEETPNPATRKFKFSDRQGEQSQEFSTPHEAELSPLAAKLFGFPWTSKIFVGPDFVAITKQDWVDWDVLTEPLIGLITEHFALGEPLWLDVKPSNDFDTDDSPLVRKIKETLAREIRPVVALDGGDVVFAKFAEGVLSVHMRGACAGCPSSQATLKQGIEVRMRELIPEILEVRSL